MFKMQPFEVERLLNRFGWRPLTPKRCKDSEDLRTFGTDGLIHGVNASSRFFTSVLVATTLWLDQSKLLPVLVLLHVPHHQNRQ